MNEATGSTLLDTVNRYVVGTTQDERLLRFSSPLGENRLLAHRFHGRERLGRVPIWTVDLISYDTDIDEHDLIGHPVSLAIRLEDGSEAFRHGLVQSLTYLGADGGLHDWQLVFVPWFTLMGYREDCRIWMDTSIVDVFTDIFDGYPEAAGRYRFDLREEYPAHTYISQINESDENFVQRWCEHEGIVWYVTHEADQHIVVFTDDVATLPASSRESIRFHTQAPTQQEDSILQWRQQYALHSSRTHYASRDYRSHQHPLTADENAVEGSTSLAALERYAYRGQYAWNDTLYGNRLLRVRMEQQESAAQRIVAISGARRLTSGEWFELRDHPLVDGKSEEQRQFTVIDIEMFAESNLPIASERRDSPGSLGELVRGFRDSVGDKRDDEYSNGRDSRSRTYGFYLSRLECQRHDLPYRSPEEHRRPEVGLQTAVVVTPPGSEVYTDRLNRIHVRFNWDRLSSDESLSSCWLRVMQQSSGPDWGAVHIPRAGEEVLVGFMDDQLDRPVVLGQLYGSHQPQWHSTGLMSGLKSKEIGGRGYNQLVMDDSTSQVRTQLASTEAETQLNLGYLIDQQGNQRGALRGNGFELRTDAYGAIRARDGLYLSTWGQPASGAQLEAEDAWRQLRTSHELTRTLSETASTHNADGLAGVENLEAFNHNASVTYGNASSSAGSQQRFEDGGGDTQHAIQSGGKGEVPGLDEALVLVSSPDGIATSTPKSTHLHSGEHLTLSTGEDISIGSGKGLLASVADRISLFVHRAGMKLIAAGGRVDIQAQQDEMELQSKQAMRLSSTDNAIILAGKKEILLTSGDAYIRLAGGNIEIHAPKTVDIKGAKKTLAGPASMSHTFKDFPEGTGSYSKSFKLYWEGTDIAASNMRYRITKADGSILEGVTGEAGDTDLLEGQVPENARIEILGKSIP